MRYLARHDENLHYTNRQLDRSTNIDIHVVLQFLGLGTRHEDFNEPKLCRQEQHYGFLFGLITISVCTVTGDGYYALSIVATSSIALNSFAGYREV